MEKVPPQGGTMGEFISFKPSAKNDNEVWNGEGYELGV
jgi:hypothetical protein